MKKRILLSCIALCSVVLGAMAQRGYNFNAVALNVDGLPEKISVVTINSGGPLSEGTKTLSSQIAQKDWGFIGLSEDFNFHTELMSSISDLYNSGTHRGKVTGTSNNTDGLGLLCAKWYSFSNESWTQWNKSDGDLMGNLTEDNGADELIDKGYRYYKITIASGFDIDVYVLHMDAASRQADIDTRESQLTQLASAVKTNTGKNKRPVIILGDTNCRYTREKLKELLIDEINKDSRFTIKDAWIEHVWNGVYPTYGGESMMTHTYGAQRGEVVDKVFYINTTESNLTLKANSYLNDESINVSDHSPIVVNFTLTDPNGTPEDVELEGPAGEVVLTDGTPANPSKDLSGTYYLRNVASGLYLKSGRAHSAQATESVHAMPMTLKKMGNNYTYSVASTIKGYLGADYYMDQGEYNWTVKEIVRSDGEKKYVFLHANGTALSSEGNGSGVSGITYNAADTKQHWMLCTADMIKDEMLETVSGTLYNASMFIPYGYITWGNNEDTRKGEWKGDPAFTGWRGNGSGAMEKWFPGNSDQRFDVYQDITGLPEGTYTLTAQAFHRDGGHGTSSKTVIPDLYATNGSSKSFTKKIASINDPSGPSSKPNNIGEAADALFPSSAYNVTLDNIAVGSDGKLRVGIRNTSTASNPNDLWCCFNNFQLLYHGTAQGDLKGTELYKGIKTAVEAANALVATQSAEVKAAYDISPVVYRYNNNLISTDGAWELALIDNAVMTAVKSQTAVGADMSLTIVNNSFEKGSTTGWTIAQGGWDTNAIRNEGNVATTNGDGTYQFNTWSGDQYECGTIYQTITGLRNGYYKLNAMVTSWNDRSVYLVGNKQHASVATTWGEGVFEDFALDFLVEDGTALIGAVGAGDGGNFYFKKGIFFKADNFRLTYMGSIGEGRVEIALADAKAKAAKLHEDAKTQFNNAVAQYESASVSGDGKAEEAAIYKALKEAIATQPRTETDMTWMITNPGFETGDWTGWTRPEAWESVVLHATHNNAPGNGEGQYVVNVWNNQAGIEGSGINKPTYQTLSGLPNGRYRLTADVASDGGNQVCAYATVGSQTVNGAASPENNATFVKASVDFEVTGNADVTIGAVGLRNGEFNAEGGCWYKCDNFRLTYLGHEGTLNEGAGVTADDWYTSLDVTRTMKKDKWNTFVVPFDMDIPEGWTVKQLVSSTSNGESISLVFDDAEGIEAGVAYMVCVESDVSELPTVMNVQVSTELNNPSTNDVEFVGVYEAGSIPAGAFFISDNYFYQAADDTNTIKAFRAYFTTKTVAKALTYRMYGDEEYDGTTGVDEAANEATVVGIYTTGGVRLNDMQEGVNILQMSNGTTVKVVIK